MRKAIILLFFGLLNGVIQSQAQVPIGQWRVHLPYAYSTSLEKVGSRVYCSSRNGLFYYDTEDNSINTLTRVEGLSDVDITFLKYSPEYATLLIAYGNGNLDLFQNGRFQQLDAITRANIPGLKGIRHIHLRGRYAYLSTAFGIVELDLQRKEFRNTFIIGPNESRLGVNMLSDDGQQFYAATDSGLFVADLNAPNLSNFNFWSRQTAWGNQPLSHIVYWRNQIHTFKADSLYSWDGNIWMPRVINAGFNNTSLFAEGNYLLMTNVFRGIAIDTAFNLLYTPDNLPLPEPRRVLFQQPFYFYLADGQSGLYAGDYNFQQILPNGPFSARALRIKAGKSGPLVAAGSLGDALFNLFIPDGVFHFKNESWISYNRNSLPALNGTWDYIDAVEHPTEDKIYLLPWGHGVKVLQNGDLAATYNPDNSTLEYIPGSIDPNTGKGDTRVGGLAFDSRGNIWMSNYGAGKPVSVLRTNGSWESYQLGQYNQLIDMLVDDFDNKWVRVRGGGMVVLNRDNNDFRFIGTAEGQGGLPSPIVNCLAKDKDGAIWVGTNEGPVVFYSPSAVFRGPFNGTRIKVLQEQFVGFLLGLEVINAIAIDGANRKWFATNSGAWLFSADGQTQIHHFTRDNSPLLSDVVTSIAVDPKTGEVFMGTDKGVVSYRGTATEGGTTHSNVEVFPNPVAPDYEGMIGVRGLFQNAFVKVTDVQGNLVYQTRADGGQFSWNGRDYNGRRVNSGVYFVLSTDASGEETFAAKILFIQ